MGNYRFCKFILEANGCSAKVQMEIDIAIDEIFGLILPIMLIYAKNRRATVQVEIKEFSRKRLELRLYDKARYSL